MAAGQLQRLFWDSLKIRSVFWRMKQHCKFVLWRSWVSIANCKSINLQTEVEQVLDPRDTIQTLRYK